MACTLVTFRARSAVRDVAKALGFPPALVERLADALDVGNAKSIQESKGLVETFGADLAERPFQNLLRIVPQLDGTPRHLGLHNGGVLISGPPLCEIVPLEPATMENRVVTQWDKDGLESAGMIKIDLLGLRMLSAIEDAVTIIEGQTGIRPDLDDLPPNDPEVFAMLCRGETIGVFQVESRAQADLIPRFQPRSFADLVIEISLIRPGPIQANMVHPYLRRRQGREKVSYLHPLLKPALKETLGVVVFQEQVIKVSRDLTGLAAGDAERLRRALASRNKRADEEIGRFRERFLKGAIERGVSLAIAERTFEQLRAFGGYAFPKSHAAAFAVLTYQSAWLRRYYPAAFFAGLLRHQPMGFYPPNVIVSEARRCGVEIRAVDAQVSDTLTTVDDDSIQLGLAIVNRLGLGGGEAITKARDLGPFQSLADFVRRTRLGRQAIEAIIWAGALDGWGVPRRRLFWDLQAALEAADRPPALLLESPDEHAEFEPLSHQERVWLEVAHTGVSSGEHLVSLIAPRLKALGVIPSKELAKLPNGMPVRIGGMIVSRQRPPTTKGAGFLAIEDEQGLVNVVLPPDIYEDSRRAFGSIFVVVEGRLQCQGKAISVLAQRVVPLESAA